MTRPRHLVGAGAVGLVMAAVAAAALLRRPTPTGPALSPQHRGGAGSPLLLLHGVGGTWHAWEPVLAHLEPHHDVLAPTLLGHCGAARFADGTPASVHALADGIEAELDRTGWGRAHVVGNSMGGWVALELARRGRAHSVVLFGPAGAWSVQRHVDAVATSIRLSVTLGARLAPYADAIAARPALRRLMLDRQVAHPERVPAAAVARTLRAAADSPGVVPLLRVLPQRALMPLPAQRDYPVRVVWAERDRVIPFERFGPPLLERVPGAELVRMPGVGHVPMYDDPAGVARQILEVTGAGELSGSCCPRPP